MVYAYYAYIALFFAVSVALFVAEFTIVEPEERDPVGETILDLVMNALLLAGMLLLAFGVEQAVIRHVWKAVSILATAYALFSNFRGRREELKKPESADDDGSIVFADAGTLLLLVPALAFNLYFAFQS